MKHLNKFNESLNSERYFFDQDCSSHWYMVPVSLREDWVLLNTDDEDDYDTISKFESKFGQYSLGGGITNITFENPIIS